MIRPAGFMTAQPQGKIKHHKLNQWEKKDQKLVTFRELVLLHRLFPLQFTTLRTITDQHAEHKPTFFGISRRVAIIGKTLPFSFKSYAKDIWWHQEKYRKRKLVRVGQETSCFPCEWTVGSYRPHRTAPHCIVYTDHGRHRPLHLTYRI